MRLVPPRVEGWRQRRRGRRTRQSGSRAPQAASAAPVADGRHGPAAERRPSAHRLSKPVSPLPAPRRTFSVARRASAPGAVGQEGANSPAPCVRIGAVNVCSCERRGLCSLTAGATRTGCRWDCPSAPRRSCPRGGQMLGRARSPRWCRYLRWPRTGTGPTGPV